jgi:carbamoyl-phosphate synthase large subunit
MNPVNLLFASAGRRVELLRLFRQAYQHLGLDGRIIATDIDPLAPALQEADGSHIVPRLDDPGYHPAIAEICKVEEIHLVFPLIDPAIPVLARGRALLEATGARVAVVSAEAAEIARDKWMTYEWLRSVGEPTPETWLGGDLPADPPFPLFVKPRYGSAGKKSFRADDRSELDFFLRYVPDPVVQPFVSGAEVTNDVFCSLEGEVWAVVSRRRIEVRWGEVHKGVTVHDQAILDRCSMIAMALQAMGPITVQCLLSEGGPLFTEINARFAGGMPLGVAAGVPSPEWYLREAAGMPVQVPPLGSYREGVYLTRYDDSFFLEGEGYEPLAGGRVRPG